MSQAAQKTAPAAAAITLANVTAGYGAAPVVQDVTFDVYAGETFGLIGLNGAGKTTLIKTILGLMEPQSGSISLFGGDLQEAEAKEKTAYLPEKFEPPVFLTGLEFIKFSLALYRRPFSESAVMEAADRVALSRDALKCRVNTYSKGMRQKTGLMGTWLTRCPLLILDEPMSGLDPRARALVKDEIMACKAQGMTVFLSSHILADMDEICDRVAVLHDGRLMFQGAPAALKKETGQEYLERAFLKVIETEKES